ncbi:MAG: hypothetical protein ACRDNW_01775 [Trebonia sp.]
MPRSRWWPGSAGRPTRSWLLRARSAFISAVDLGLLTGAGVAVGGCLLAMVVLPRRH